MTAIANRLERLGFSAEVEHGDLGLVPGKRRVEPPGKRVESESRSTTSWEQRREARKQGERWWTAKAESLEKANRAEGGSRRAVTGGAEGARGLRARVGGSRGEGPVAACAFGAGLGSRNSPSR
jgi:hypothetical protein